MEETSKFRLLVSTVKELISEFNRMTVTLTAVSAVMSNLATRSMRLFAPAEAIRFEYRLKDLGATVAYVLLPTFEKLSDNVRAIAKWFYNLDDGTKKIINTFATWLAPIAAVSMALSGVATVFKGVLSLGASAFRMFSLFAGSAGGRAAGALVGGGGGGALANAMLGGVSAAELLGMGGAALAPALSPRMARRIQRNRRLHARIKSRLEDQAYMDILQGNYAYQQKKYGKMYHGKFQYARPERLSKLDAIYNKRLKGIEGSQFSVRSALKTGMIGKGGALVRGLGTGVAMAGAVVPGLMMGGKSLLGDVSSVAISSLIGLFTGGPLMAAISGIVSLLTILGKRLFNKTVEAGQGDKSPDNLAVRETQQFSSVLDPGRLLRMRSLSTAGRPIRDQSTEEAEARARMIDMLRFIQNAINNAAPALRQQAQNNIAR